MINVEVLGNKLPLSFSLSFFPCFPFSRLPVCLVRQVNALQTTHTGQLYFLRCFWVGMCFTGITAEVRGREKDLRETVSTKGCKLNWFAENCLGVFFFFLNSFLPHKAAETESLRGWGRLKKGSFCWFGATRVLEALFQHMTHWNELSQD